VDKCTKKFIKEYVEKNNKDNLSILEVGSLDVNGSIRGLFADVAGTYHGVDIKDGPGVEYVGHLTAESVLEKLEKDYDLVLCLNALEHDQFWRDTFVTCLNKLKVGGDLLIVQPSSIDINSLKFIANQKHSVVFGDTWHENNNNLQFVTETPGVKLSDHHHQMLMRHYENAVSNTDIERNHHSKHFSFNLQSSIRHNVHHTEDKEYYGSLSLGSLLETMTLANLVNNFNIDWQFHLVSGVVYNLRFNRIE